FSVALAGCNPMIISVRPPAVVPSKPFNDFLDGVEAMQHKMVAERMPPLALTSLDTYVDEHKRASEEAFKHDPFGELGTGVRVKLHCPILGWKTESNVRLIGRRGGAKKLPLDRWAALFFFGSRQRGRTPKWRRTVEVRGPTARPPIRRAVGGAFG